MTTTRAIGRKLTQRQQSKNLVLTKALVDHFSANPEPEFSLDVVRIMADVLLGNRRDQRDRRFGPSGRGTCLRRQMLSFLDFPQAKAEAGLSWVYAQGTEIHIMLQLVLLQLGLAYDIEVGVRYDSWHSWGRIDAVGRLVEPIDFGSHYGVDIKSTSAPEHQIRSTEAKVLDFLANKIPPPEPSDWFFWRQMWKAWLQAHTYMLLSDKDPNVDPIDFFILLYAHKGNDGRLPFREVLVPRHPVAMAIVAKEIEALTRHAKRHTLPDMLPGCERKPGTDKTFKACPYRQVCEKAEWPQPVALRPVRKIKLKTKGA